MTQDREAVTAVLEMARGGEAVVVAPGTVRGGEHDTWRKGRPGRGGRERRAGEATTARVLEGWRGWQQ